MSNNGILLPDWWKGEIFYFEHQKGNDYIIT